jgi:hypothetical protein
MPLLFLAQKLLGHYKKGGEGGGGGGPVGMHKR